MTLRLQKIVEAIPQVKILADVGCDHGYIGLGALRSGKAQSVTFVDISRLSLQKAKDNCPSQYLPSCQFLCQDGLASINCDCAVIAGMGGLETISILQNATQPPKYLVLQPMRNQVEVRKYLCQTGLEITLDVKFFDGKYYDLICATRSGKSTSLTALQLQFGLTNLQNPTEDFVNFCKTEQQKYTQILTQCNDGEVQQMLQLINSVLALI